MHWISKSGNRQPHLSSEDWGHRGWLLIRKVAREGVSTTNDRRVAATLLSHSTYSNRYHRLRTELEAIAYGATQGESPDSDPTA